MTLAARRGEVFGPGQRGFRQPDRVAGIVVFGLPGHAVEDVRADGAVTAAVRGAQPDHEVPLRQRVVVGVVGAQPGDPGELGGHRVQPLPDLLRITGVVQDLGDQTQIVADRAEHLAAAEDVIQMPPCLGDPFQVLRHRVIHPLTAHRGQHPGRVEQPVMGERGQPGTGEGHEVPSIHAHRLQDLPQRRDRPAWVPWVVQAVVGWYVERARARLPPQGCQGHRLAEMA